MKVEVIKAEKIRGGRKILNVSDLTIERGKIYAVIGPNGSGKTTLLRTLAGIDKEAFTNILYDGNEFIPRNRIAYMTQNAYLFDTTVWKNLLLGIEDSGLSPEEMETTVTESLKKVGMESFAKSKVRFLSGGETQRVAAARIMIMKKDLILLDEPSSATDIKGAEMIEDYIKEVNEKDGKTIVLSTHSPSQAQRLAHEVIFINSGIVTEKGVPSKVLFNPEHEETERFLKNWKISRD